VHSQFELTREQYAAIDQRLDHAEQASKRLGRRDWLTLAYGGLRQREVVTLRLLLDMDNETTARVLGIAPGTVGAHLHQAVVKLRAAIPSHYGQEISK
jgi:DNA-directed RNA polymerase specialized sigma24 family protein